MPMLSHHVWIGFAGGILAFAHCLGMCGGFALHLSREREGSRLFAPQFAWHAGRLSTYLFLGALAGFAGHRLHLFIVSHGLWQNLLGYLAAAAMLLAGLSLLGLLPARPGGGVLQQAWASFSGRLLQASSPGAALALGIGTGFLPCPIILAFVAYALQTGSIASGAAAMAGLALGSMLPLLALGGAARLTGWHLRRWAPQAGGIILIFLATSTALRGSSVFHKLLGCPQTPTMQHQQVHSVPPTEGRPHCPGHDGDGHVQ